MSTLSLRALLTAAAVFLSAGAFLAPAAHAQATRTWVSGVGDDVNPCSRTAPCKTFAGSISKTAAGGEINVLDPGGFGAVTITKAITIDASSVEAGILIGNGLTGVIVNAGPNDNVTLKGLDFSGINTGTGCPNANKGIRVVGAGSVRIEDSKIERMQTAVEIAPTAAVDVFMDHVDISNSCTSGVRVAPGAGGSANVAIQDSTITNSGTALSVADRGKAWLTRSTLFANTLGYELLGAGEINDYGDNRLIGNTADGTPTKDLAPSVNAAVPGPAGPQGPQGVAGPQGAQGAQGEPALKLLLASSQSSLALKAGKAVTLSYAATAAAKSTLTITKGAKKIATVTGSSKAGSNTIKWNGKAGKKAAAAGAYKLTLSALGTDGQKATTTVSLKLK